LRKCRLVESTLLRKIVHTIVFDKDKKMHSTNRIVTGAVAAALFASAAFAAGHGGNPAVNARKAHMQVYAHNIGILGAMARGNAEYNAEAAVAAAGNLAGLAALDQTSYWVPGTDSDSLPDESRALPALFDNLDDVEAKRAALEVAAVALAAVADDGLDAVRAGLGPVGAACGACHEDYQKPRD